jgi:hypothetical protein
MALHKGLLKQGVYSPNSEKHFHDYDQIWIILSGRGTVYWIDHAGKREDFILEAGDVWMVPAGYEHGSEGFKETGKNSDDYTAAIINGTLPVGSHKPGHYYIEKEHYIATLEVRKTPTDRYKNPPKNKA